MGMVRKLSFKSDKPPPYHTFDFHRKRALKRQFHGTSIDSYTNHKLMAHAVENLISLLDIPSHYNLFFLNKGISLMTALLKITKGNIVLTDTPFVKKSFGQVTKKNALLKMGSEGTPRHRVSEKSLLCYDHIDPNTGQIIDFHYLKKNFQITSIPVVHADISLSVPTEVLDFKNIHSYYFSTRFGFGMNPGIIVWMANNDIFKKTLTEYNNYIKSIPENFLIQDQRSVFYDVNLEQIYILGMIASDMMNRGIQIIRNEIKYKSVILYNALRKNRKFDVLVKDLNDQSNNILCARVNASPKKVFDFFIDQDIELDVYEGDAGITIIRMANYPVHSKEQVEYLADTIAKF
jgi:phosphoserine aminotransferase